MDSSLLADMLHTVRKNRYSVDSMLIVRNGTVVLDAYVHPFGPGQTHVIRSCTKSIISALIGIAIDEGYIENVDQPIIDFFPGRTVSNLDADKEAVTLANLLTMSSGLQCRDSYLYRWRGLNDMKQSGDWVQYMLDLPMAEEPGSHFEYCNGGSFLLSALIQETTGMSALAFAEEHLFEPLGISDLVWPTNQQGINIGWGELRMRPHDMAKIGYLYLNAGRWDGEQVMPAEWVEESSRSHITARTLQNGYGYQWWIHPSGIYMALGYGGQYIVVVPESDLVVVITSDLPETQFFVPYDLLSDFIIPAVKASKPLPSNAKGNEQLAAAHSALDTP